MNLALVMLEVFVVNYNLMNSAESTTTKFELDRRQQVIGFFVFNSEVGVTGDSEGSPLLDIHTDEQRVQVGCDHLPHCSAATPTESLFLIPVWSERSHCTEFNWPQV